MASKASVAVIGGGITGLVTAYALRDRAHVALFESSERLGGKIRTERLDGAIVELGPDSFLPRDEVPLELCRAFGLGNDLVEPADFGAWLWVSGKLVRLPEGFVLGLPAAPLSILRSRVLSPAGALRASMDLFLPGPLRGPDVSVASFIRRRFGSQVLERLVDPLLAGTRAGDVETMSLAAAAMPVDDIARRHRSVTLGLRRAARAQQGGPPRFFGLREGMSSLVDALEGALENVDVIRSAPVEGLAREGDRYRISAAGGSVIADRVVVAVPAHAAARLLAGAAPGAASDLERISYASVAVANLIYPPGAASIPEQGSGFLVPRSENRTIAACTWFSKKWPHASPDDGRIVLRCFAGRSAGEPALSVDDDPLLASMRADVEEALHITAEPSSSRLIRWDRAIPQLEVGHLALIDDIERSLRREAPGVVVAGAGYRGTGIPDCIAQAYAAAEGVLAP